MRRPPQILKQQILVGPLRVRFGNCSRSRAIHDGWDTTLAIQTRIGTTRHADGENVGAENALAVPLNHCNEPFVSGARVQCFRQQHALDVDADTVESCNCLPNQRTQPHFDGCGILFGRHPPVELQREPIGNDVRIDTAVQQPYIIVG